MMFRLLVFLYRRRVLERVNTILYKLRDLPLLGSKKNRYGYGDIKRVLLFLGVPFEILWAFIRRIFAWGWVTIFAALPAYFLKRQITPAFLLPAVVWLYLVVRFFRSRFIGMGDELYALSNYFRISPKRRMRSVYIAETILLFCGDAVVATIAGKIAFNDGPSGAAFALMLAAAMQTGEACSLLVFGKKPRSMAPVLLELSLLAGILWTHYAVGLTLPAGFFKTGAVVAAIALALSTAYLLKFSRYSKYLPWLDKDWQEVFDAENIERAAFRESARADDVRDVPVSGAFGGAELNRLFFLRHGKKRRKRVRAALVFLLAATLFVHAAPAIFSRFPVGYELLYGAICLVPFFGAMFFFDEDFLRACFSGCDLPLLYYGMYKEGDLLRAVFRGRERSLLLENLPVLIALWAGLCSIAVRWRLSIDAYLFALVVPALVLLFFVRHLLFSYLYFQPFTESGKTRRTSYRVLFNFTIALSYAIFAIRPKGPVLVGALPVLTLLYVLVTGYLAKKRGKTRFVIRRDG
ncbi:Uncharacterised protein [Aedoeadaptatus ivorii]|uniref:Uncharacterized protein n=1 Tax=Aedoeadaptatus ivorii TaxID=54006 RepID=A0A448V379_9FIRM|nr:hypothetical protein [Peptoniphilus ivorii]VEJ36248.1 Uncharacterised protein [Peptoniphilus ivorii]